MAHDKQDFLPNESKMADSLDFCEILIFQDKNLNVNQGLNPRFLAL